MSADNFLVCPQVPPEPPEQAGRSLYERLEISGMRSQLLRRSADLKKNVNGSQKYLDVLREMSAVVSTVTLQKSRNTKSLPYKNKSVVSANRPPVKRY